MTNIYQSYQQMASRTLPENMKTEYSQLEIGLLWNAVGLAGECGELMAVINEPPWDVSFIVKELGDCFWYLSAICTKLNLSLEKVVPANVNYFAGAGVRDFAYQLGILASGNLLDYIKKGVFHQSGIDVEKIEKMLADIAFFLVAIAQRFGTFFSVDDVLTQNIEKLKVRYPEGFVSGGGIRA